MWQHLHFRRTDSDFSIDSANFNEDDMSSESEMEETDKARVYTSSKPGSPQKLVSWPLSVFIPIANTNK